MHKCYFSIVYSILSNWLQDQEVVNQEKLPNKKTDIWDWESGSYTVLLVTGWSAKKKYKSSCHSSYEAW